MRYIVGYTVTCVVLALAAPADAGSIWAKGGARTQGIFADDTARQIGDVLTIIIEERSVIENETEREMEKNSERQATINSNLDLLNTVDRATGKLFNLKDLNLDIKAKTKFDGKADFDSDRKVVDAVTVVVEDVLPNGNLVVLGKRTREVSGDTQMIEISGVVRPSDITFSNTVSSKQVADFHVVYKTKGLENRFTKPGWLDQLLNYLNPF